MFLGLAQYRAIGAPACVAGLALANRNVMEDWFRYRLHGES